MIKRMVVMAAVLILLFGGIFGYKYFEGQMVREIITNFTPPPISVSAAKATTGQWDQYLYGTGSLTAIQGIELAAETSGIIRALHFQAGDKVKTGDLILELDDTVEQASLKSAQAQLKLARLNFNRDSALIRKNAISQTRFDETSATFEQAKAAVEQIEATIAKKRITAPFEGSVGIRQVEIGDFLDKGNVIVNLQNLDQMYVDFTLPEQDWPRVKEGQTVLFEVPAYDHILAARVISTAVMVDDNTRNIQIRALTDNPDKKLLPGMFTSVRIMTGERISLVKVPTTAVTYNLYGNTIYVINEVAGNDETRLQVTSRAISTGEERDNEVQIVSGIEAGEQIVTAGQLKLRNNAHVAIVPDAPALQSQP